MRSPRLERKFYESAVPRRKDINKALKDLKADVHPSFHPALDKFKKELKGILKQYPETIANDNKAIAIAEISDLHEEVKNSNGRYNVKLGAAIIDDLDKAA